ncbi:tRNA (adenosine(37)-N6)-threonylcarbamoyltransferase complex dimerization subunit type 1 TsaB [Rhodothermaceae bacterium RA]|nr:tRNA (adenosine(37)-N6)-threonylcarbamoyltransferase complex dimerization subunit type 1 TsaB [Rhodothermaceae bacterium RA]
MPTYLLALETATDVCSAALTDGDRLLVEETLHRARLHAERLVLLIEDVLRHADLTPAALAAVAVSGGPGSYTGLRIGVSTAKGLAAATGAALVAVPSLEAQAAAVAPFAAAGDLILPAFNSRRDEVYLAAFRRDDAGTLHPVGAPAALPVTAVPDWLRDLPAGPCWLAGEGAPRLAPALAQTDRLHRLVPLTAAGPAARHVARLGWARYAAGETEDLAAFEPRYLKDFVAKKPRASVFEKLSF